MYGGLMEAFNPSIQQMLLTVFNHKMHKVAWVQQAGPRPFAWCKSRGPNALIRG
jgi:hypothetical protein